MSGLKQTVLPDFRGFEKPDEFKMSYRGNVSLVEYKGVIQDFQYFDDLCMRNVNLLTTHMEECRELIAPGYGWALDQADGVLEATSEDMDVLAALGQPHENNFGGRSEIKSCREVARLMEMVFNCDCAGIPTVDYKVYGNFDPFVMKVPYFYFLDKEMFDKRVMKLFLMSKKTPLISRNSSWTWSDLIRFLFYAEYLGSHGFSHPIAWLQEEEQWWFKRLNNFY